VKEIILLDPKYRGDTQGLVSGLDDLHRYKDAIVGPNRQRLVTYAVALCPAEDLEASRYFRPEYVAAHGFGAICLSPVDNNADAKLRDFLRKVLGCEITPAD
jgi:hypothetical protein